jgi:hypothetical protein
MSYDYLPKGKMTFEKKKGIKGVKKKTYSVLEVVDKPRLIQETTVLDLLHRIFVDQAESTIDSLVDDLDGQVLAG